MTEDKELIVRPALNPVQAENAMKEYQAIVNSVLDESDVQNIQGKAFKKKSAWRKLAKVFNLSLSLVEERSEKLSFNGKDVLAFHFRARATAPNGAFAEGTGSCDTSEKGMEKTIHNTRTIAETRSINRAISSLIGAGEVSAEEVEGDSEHTPTPPKTLPKKVGVCLLCNKDLIQSKFNELEYYCSGYKEGCKVKGQISALAK